MSKVGVLRIAINAPLSRLFDYLPGSGALPAPGTRVQVPFGRRLETGIVMEQAANSELPRSRLKQVRRSLDTSPLLSTEDLWLIRFVSDYYHHPIGEVAAAAIPALLRQGRPLVPTTRALALTEAGRSLDPGTIEKRAPQAGGTAANRRWRCVDQFRHTRRANAGLAT